MTAHGIPICDRFWAKVDCRGPDECWPWTRYVGKYGYAFFTFGPRPQTTRPVHRLAYEFAIGPIPDGLVIDHRCRNRACCNPAHLEAVSSAENDRRALPYLRRGKAHVHGAKTHCPQGHPYDEVNTKVIPSRPTARYCRACHDEEQRTRRHAAEASS